MTDFIEQIKADREAGTGGPWRVRLLEDFGFNVVHYIGGDKFNLDRVAKCRSDTNARRIGRVPKMEDLLIAQEAALKAALERLEASEFTNAEHEQAKAILRKATQEGV